MERNSWLKEYQNKGFTVLPELFSDDALHGIEHHLSAYLEKIKEGVVFEKDGQTVRGAHGLHLFDDFFAELTKNEKILPLARQALDGDVYVHQFKVNFKQSYSGKSWPWHQDYVFWRELDFVPTPNLINIAIFLDDVDYLGGPLWFIPESHTLGDLSANQLSDQKGESWKDNVAEYLNFQVPADEVSKLSPSKQAVAMTGKAGDVVLFNPQLVHCSANNLSDNSRRLLIITYNQSANLPLKTSSRPDFLCSPFVESL
ncbi:phytanoyl-CoA dioxygenase family protein [Pseudoalteromonas luteoviolacea]|uniref:Phytanoyl-CoA dioxygenase n=1 Tax=Pseudoalteromonas luteoviolacea S4054 TaxID=1129367 RepID=A0A0F6ABY1_9GAMM|nr:phytanoyl-CoA dioxygenase family protein [Pseudoalteromonas luteoviolacea]AOT10633.1 hypothetical protein S4054249_22495 [Pseudoalteromonas luteoviolacea]AOT15299.1 hypothetical protein S40542_21100 [Pseudoalteromonas luteoviolacea]AOT20452.1 hypothetical protein S4054_22410 [Pseudoalteromonas luteoviolacea]KKE83732.1 hypothetical protein N479_12965 [Pseudoalteromonas luteoviolacea S4054]KZN71936.1 hypothetical protein N481_17330 [Pseudoalteromonas luteoviolacea S4047-1]